MYDDWLDAPQPGEVKFTWPTAKEIRLKINDDEKVKFENNVNNMMNYFIKKIDNEASKGKYFYITNVIDESPEELSIVVKKLKRLGYRVTFEQYSTKSLYMKISWKSYLQVFSEWLESFQN